MSAHDDPAGAPDRPGGDPAADPAGADDAATAAAEALAADLWAAARAHQGPLERARAARVGRMLASPGGLDLVMALTDEVLADPPAGPGRGGAGRPGRQPTGRRRPRPHRWGCPAGRRPARGPAARLVVPAARQRVRAEMAGVILPANRWRLARHAERRRRQGIRLNVNVLGEAILGEDEAEQRLQRVLDVLGQPDVDYVSVKISSICSQLDVLRFEREVERIASRLRRLYDAANGYRPAKFVNLDMEEYRDLELTLAVFRRVLDEDAYAGTTAGIVLQAYLPDSLPALEELCAMGSAASRPGGRRGEGPFGKRGQPGDGTGRRRAPRLAGGTLRHQGRDRRQLQAHARCAARPRQRRRRSRSASPATTCSRWPGPSLRPRPGTDATGSSIEMLEGMAPALAEEAARRFGGLLPVRTGRGPGRHRGRHRLPRPPPRREQRARQLPHPFLFPSGRLAGLEDRSRPLPARRGSSPSPGRADPAHPAPGRRARGAPRPAPASPTSPTPTSRSPPTASGSPVTWKPSGKPGCPTTGRWWAVERSTAFRPRPAWTRAPAARRPTAGSRPTWPWWRRRWPPPGPPGPSGRRSPVADRRRLLEGAADGLARRRGRLLAVMAFDAAKTVREGDPEVSEAIDFATYYAAHIPAAGCRLSAPRHRGGGLAMELPAVDPGRRPARGAGRRERRDLQACSRDRRHRRRAGRGHSGPPGCPARCCSSCPASTATPAAGSSPIPTSTRWC